MILVILKEGRGFEEQPMKLLDITYAECKNVKNLTDLKDL